MEKTCVDCQSTATNKWYSGPRCYNCYKRNWKLGIKQPKPQMYGPETVCSGCGTNECKRHNWYKGPLCRDCFRKPRLITGKFHKKRELGIGCDHPEYSKRYSAHRRANDPNFKGDSNERTQAYQLSKRRRTPPNLSKENKELIKQFYRDCVRGMSVDHIIPLNGKNVSGLHVPWNLQYLSRSENSRKGNRVA